MDMMDVIKGRRSIRKFKPDLIPEEALRTVMDAVRWAPSWANTQCWEIIVVKDPKVKLELAETLPKGNPAVSSMMNAPASFVLVKIIGFNHQRLLSGCATTLHDFQLRNGNNKSATAPPVFCLCFPFEGSLHSH
jgi:nitroreductase